MAMRIAVVIPTHNRAGLLGRALDSVFDQSAPAEECLVVDDGSTDGTEKLVRGRYPRATYLGQAHTGVSAARNAGIAATRADWVAFLDSDDAWKPDKLERQRSALEGTDYAVCHTDEIWIRRGRRVQPMDKHRKRGGWIYRHCLPLCPISPSTSMVRRDVLVAAGGFDETLPACEDYDMWLRLCARHAVLYVDEALAVRYGGHADQLSARHWGMDRFRVAALEKMLHAPYLTGANRRRTLEMLVHKLNILVGGARKRGNEAVITAYQPRLRRYAWLLSLPSPWPSRLGFRTSSYLLHPWSRPGGRGDDRVCRFGTMPGEGSLLPMGEGQDEGPGNNSPTPPEPSAWMMGGGKR